MMSYVRGEAGENPVSEGGCGEEEERCWWPAVPACVRTVLHGRVKAPPRKSRRKHADIRLWDTHRPRRPPAMKLTPELIQAVPSTLNPVKERQLDLRGESCLPRFPAS